VGAEEQTSGLAKVIDHLQVRAERAELPQVVRAGGATSEEVVRSASPE